MNTLKSCFDTICCGCFTSSKSASPSDAASVNIPSTSKKSASAVVEHIKLKDQKVMQAAYNEGFSMEDGLKLVIKFSFKKNSFFF